MSEISNVGRKYNISSEETFAPGELSKPDPKSRSSSTTATTTTPCPGFDYVTTSKESKTIDDQGVIHIESEQTAQAISDAARFAGTKITGASAEVKSSSIFSFLARG